MSEDFFDAAAVGDGVAVRMSANVAETLTHLAGELIRFLETGEVEPAKTGVFRRTVTAADVRRRMFPDAYRDRVEAEAFRERHSGRLRDPSAARRVRQTLTGGTNHVLSRAQVGDWISTFGLARFLTLDRKSKRLGMVGSWVNHVQETLILATNVLAVPADNPSPPQQTTSRVQRSEQ
ncbi:DUF2017 family protein [Actinokineospora sp.]|uniref:DUF2017 family protein n=1 Tax=Actinokineospora sp. TaxID=1872133 RepID=UPI003D6A71A7